MNQEEGSKVLLVSSYTLPYHAGGGLNAFNFGKYLVSKGISAKILTFNRNLKLPLVSLIEGLKVVRIPYFNKGYLLKIFSLTIIIPWYIVEIFRNNIIIIYGGYIIGWEFIPIIGRIAGKRVIFRSTMFGEDDIESLLRYSRYLLYIRKLSLNSISNYMSQTPKFSESYRKYFPTSLKLVETSQGVDTRTYCRVDRSKKIKLRESLGIPEKEFVIISVGAVVIRKGYIKIFQQLEKLNIPYLYIVLGDYDLSNENLPQKKTFKAKEICAFGEQILKSKIQFLGFVNNVHEYLQASDIFLTASTREGLSNALLEAMATGLPVLTRNISAIKDYLIKDRYNGFIFEDEKQLRDLIYMLFENEKIRSEIGLKACLTLNANFSFENTMNKLGI